MTTYANIELALPMTWNPDEFWVAFEIKQYLGDSYDYGNGIVEYMGECKYGEHGEFAHSIKILVELRIPFVLRIEEEEGVGSTSSFDGFQRLNAEGYHEIVLSESAYEEIVNGKHTWAGSAQHYFEVAGRFSAENLVVDHLGALVPPDPRTRHNIMILDMGMGKDSV